jgi:hypothetical protein
VSWRPLRAPETLQRRGGLERRSIVATPGGSLSSGSTAAVALAAGGTNTASAAVDETPASGLVTDESGHADTFDLVLTSQPAADVTFAVTSSDPAEGLPTPSSITFTPADWNVPQTITVTGVDDAVDDGDVAYSILLAPGVSDDPDYSGLVPGSVGVTNGDNDVAGIQVTPNAGLATTEAGGTATLSVVLTSQPTASVVIPVASSDPSEGGVSSSSLTFTTANWNVAQTITVTGVDDLIDDGEVAYTITLGALLGRRYLRRDRPGGRGGDERGRRRRRDPGHADRGASRPRRQRNGEASRWC